MTAITLRDSNSLSAPGANVKNLPLTNNEVDNNFSRLSLSIGVNSNLITTETGNLVVAINEIKNDVISLDARTDNTEANITTLFADLANVDLSSIALIDANVGVLSQLTTANKTNIVSAINEIVDLAGLDGTISGVVISNSTWSGNTIAIAQGGTGATTNTQARINLGLGTMAVQNHGNITVVGGTIGGNANVNTTGNIQAAFFIGDGSLLTGISGGGGGGSGLFNTAINLSSGAEVPFTQGNVYIAPSTAGTRYVLHSVHVTNVNGLAMANVSGELDGANYPAISFANTVPVPAGSSVEMLKKPKILQPTDYIQMTTDTANALHVSFTLETSTEVTMFGKGVDITASATYTDLYTATANAVIESVLLSNDDGVNDVKARVVWTNGADVIQGYYCYDLIVPADATVELLEQPKFIPNGYKVRVYANVGGRLEAMIAGKTVS